MRKTIYVLMLAFVASIAYGAPTPPTLNASSYYLLDFATGQVLAEKNADKQIEPASITKILTAYVVFDSIKSDSVTLDEKALVSNKASIMKGSKMFIKSGAQVSINNLLHGMIVSSGNDASIALAEHISGSEEAFADLMNDFAAKLGMKNSHFVNATGWPEKNHYTTAHDVALLSAALIKNFPKLYQTFKKESFSYGKSPGGKPIVQNNRNGLLKIKGLNADGIKTGHTDAAGYCLASSAIKNNMRLVSVVMGTKSTKARNLASQRLLNFGFRHFQTKKLFNKNQIINQVEIRKGTKNMLNVGAAMDIHVTSQKSPDSKLKIRILIDKPLIAPVKKGEQVGVIMATKDGKMLEEFALVALEEVEESHIFVRIWDSIAMYFAELF